MIIINEKDRGNTIIENLNVTRNGIYQEANKAYSPVIVEVPEMVLNELSVTENGEYIPSQGTDGFSKVNVNVALPENGYLLKTVKDDVVSFDDDSILPMPSVIADINAVQDLHGYDSPWVGGSGKNKLDEASLEGGYTLSTATGLPTSSVSSSENRIATTSPIKITGENVTVSFKSTINTVYFMYSLFNSDTLLTRVTGKSSETTINCSGATDMYIAFYDAQGSNITSGVVSDVQVELGSTATSYAPYSNICPISGFNGGNVNVSPTTSAQDGTTYSVSWQSQAGTVYGGNIDLVSGVLTVTHGGVDMDTLNWVYDSPNARFYTASVNDIVTGKTYSALKSTIYRTYSSVGTPSSEDFIISQNYVSALNPISTAVILIKDSNYTNVAALKAMFQETNAQVVYELATPLTYQLTPIQVNSLFGVNNVWNDTNGETEVKYFGK